MNARDIRKVQEKLEAATWKWWFYLIVVLIQSIPSFASKGYDLRRMGEVIGVILSGANEDGARGLAAIEQRGGLAVIQEPATAESSVMPAAAVAAVTTAELLPLEEIAPFLTRACRVMTRVGDGHLADQLGTPSP